MDFSSKTLWIFIFKLEKLWEKPGIHKYIKEIQIWLHFSQRLSLWRFKFFYEFFSDKTIQFLVSDDVFALLYYIKSFNDSFYAILSYEERGLMSSIVIMSEKWGFKLEKLENCSDFEEILKEAKINFSNEIYFFQLK